MLTMVQCNEYFILLNSKKTLKDLVIHDYIYIYIYIYIYKYVCICVGMY